MLLIMDNVLPIGGEEGEAGERHLELGQVGADLGIVSVLPLDPLLAKFLILLNCLGLDLGHFVTL